MVDEATQAAAAEQPLVQQAPNAQPPVDVSAPAGIDVSKATIIVLVILTLVVSILGTWTVLVETDTLHIVEIKEPVAGTLGGEMSLRINGQNTPVSVGGAADITITNP